MRKLVFERDEDGNKLLNDIVKARNDKVETILVREGSSSGNTRETIFAALKKESVNVDNKGNDFGNKTNFKEYEY